MAELTSDMVKIALTVLTALSGVALWAWRKSQAPVDSLREAIQGDLEEHRDEAHERFVEQERRVNDHEVRLRGVERETRLHEEILGIHGDQLRRSNERAEIAFNRLHDRVDRLLDRSEGE